MILFVSSSPGINVQVATFLSDNGMKYVTLRGILPWHHYQGLLVAIARKGSAFLRTSDTKHSFHMDAQVFVVSSLADVSLDLLTNITLNKVQKTVIVSQTSSNANKMAEWTPQLQSMKHNSLFYLAIPNLHGTLWYQIITLNAGYSLTKLTFHSVSYLIKEHYDLNGLTVRSISDTWAPFLTIDKCNEGGKNCKINKGCLVDFMDIASKEFNFTYVSEKEPNGDWGLVPKSGPFNMSGEWSGVMGNVVKGTYDMSMSPWQWNEERDNLVQFVLIIKSKQILVWEPKNPEIDFCLFIRPITTDSWLAICLTASVIITCLGLISFFVPYLKDSDARKITITTTCYFFILIDAFYGGALTMFFTSTVTIPLENLRDTLKAHPQWKLMFISGLDAIFAYPALQGDHDYVDYWSYVKDNPKDTTFLGISEGLNHLHEGDTVIFLEETMLKGYLKNNPFLKQNLEIFWKSKDIFNGIIFPLNSPLVPMFKMGEAILRERGIKEIIFNRWQGKNINEDSSASTMVLGPGQTALVFVIMLSICVVCLLLFLGEVAHSYNTKLEKEANIHSKEQVEVVP